MPEWNDSDPAEYERKKRCGLTCKVHPEEPCVIDHRPRELPGFVIDYKRHGHLIYDGPARPVPCRGPFA